MVKYLLLFQFSLSIWSGEITCFRGGTILGDSAFDDRDLWVRDGIIVEPQLSADHIIDMSGYFIAPGFIDLQVNGGFGIDFTKEPQHVDVVARQLVRFGVTSFLPTLVSSEAITYGRAIPFLKPHNVKGGAEILGMHLEGPFIHPDKCGCHRKDYLENTLSLERIEERYGSLEGVKMLTLAPELLADFSDISRIKNQGIIVAAGHTTASTEQAQRAIEHGVSMVTHIWNAMNGIHHREPGLIALALTTDGISYGCICDGVHVDSLAVKLAWRAHSDGFVLVTDAMQALGLPFDVYTCGDVNVDVSALGAYVCGTNTLAGSVCPMDQMVRNMIQFTGCSIMEALRAASQKPAEVLGIFPKKGSLEHGADADFVIMDKALKIRATYKAGVELGRW